jgi:hypothetical protein
MLFNVQTRMQYLLNNLILLPVNYLFELGFFFLIGILWIKTRIKRDRELDPFSVAELTLLGVVLFLTTFFYSTLIVINDFGVRAWLPGQFVLLIWAVDILAPALRDHIFIRTGIFDHISMSGKLSGVLKAFFILGLLTSILEIAATRLWPMLVDVNIVGFPNDLSPDTHLGKRTFAARQAYDFIRENVGEELVIQNNPVTSLDRPGGLYGDHQFAVADRTAYGVPPEELKRLTDGVSRIFNSRNIPNWESLDEVCEQYSIDIIIVNDTDPLWAARDQLRAERPPEYENNYYAIFPCGQ